MSRAPHVLVARLDSAGDVLLAGPAVRAVAAGAREVTLLHGPRGRAAAELLPGVDRLVEFWCPWIDATPPPVDPAAVQALVDHVRALDVDVAVVLTSFHQSPLPTALLLRMAGVPRLAALSEDFPGSLLDVRHRGLPDGLHEVERALSLAGTLGFALPEGDDGGLAVTAGREAAPGGLPDRYVVVHPGTSVPARGWAPERHAALVDDLLATGRDVVVTGAPDEARLCRAVAGPPRPGVLDLGGATSLRELAGVLAGADAVVVGNTGPAHLAAAVRAPVVSLFAPTVPAERWRPYGTELRLLGRDVPCAGCRAKACPVPGHPCVDAVTPHEALAAIEELAPAGRTREVV